MTGHTTADGLREAVEKLLAREVAQDRGARVRLALGDVRCLDCNLRYDERQEYGCGDGGRGHDYPDDWLAEAAAKANAEPIEYVSINVAELTAALAAHPVPSDTEEEREVVVARIAKRRLDLLRAVVSYDNANQSDLPLGLLNSIRAEVGGPR